MSITVDRPNRVAVEVVTWTTSTATRSDVREPNIPVIVEFEVEGETVRATGQITTDESRPVTRSNPSTSRNFVSPTPASANPKAKTGTANRFDPV